MRFCKAQSLMGPFAVLCFLMLRLGAAEFCPVNTEENHVIDIQAALTKGIKGMEPMSVTSEQECMIYCCSSLKIAGTKLCNLMIYDTRKTYGQPNCYLFHCPSEEACPLKPAEGILTSRVYRDVPYPSRGNLVDHSPSPQTITPAPRLLAGSWKPTDVAGGDVFSQTSECSEDPSELKPAVTQFPAPREKGRPLSSTPGAPPSSTTTTTAVSSSPAATTPKRAAVPSTRTSANTPVTRPRATVARQSPGVPSSAAAASRAAEEVTPQASEAASGVPRPSSSSPRAPPDPEGPPEMVAWRESSRLALDSGRALSRMDSALVSAAVALGSGGGPLGIQAGFLLEKGLLLGTLLFGVLLLTIGLVLLGRMLAESLRRKRYSRLDYLINGIYVDI